MVDWAHRGFPVFNRLTRTKLISFLFVLFIGQIVALPKETPECECGYGGLCLKGQSSLLNRTSCSLCQDLWEPMNRTLYQSCDVIVDHCSSNPCSYGECVRTIGSYFCQCPKNKFGQRCNITYPDSGTTHISSEIYVYYQMQPNRDGLNEFIVIYDVKNFGQSKEGLRLEIEISDGRILYPIADHFTLSNVRRACWAETKASPEILDDRLCYLLPEGDVWSFKFKTTFPFGGYNRNLKYLPEFKKPIGRVGNVTISVTGVVSGSRVNFYHSRHELFTYYQFRLPHNCLDVIGFSACSIDPGKPTRYRSDEIIRVFSIEKLPHCRGVEIMGNRWLVQKHIDCPRRTVAFRVPEVVEDFNDRRRIAIRPEFFQEGNHMLVFEHIMRGEVPYFGVTGEFSTEHYCWIQIVRTSNEFVMRDAEETSVYCQRPMNWGIFTLDRGYDENFFNYFVTCDHPEDPECKVRRLTRPFLKKKVTPCGTVYNFSIVAVDRYHMVKNVTFSAIAHFIKSHVRLRITCLWNCFPTMDPQHRSVIAVKSSPYVHGTVSWNITVSNASHSSPFTDFFHGYDVFFNSTASRIIRLDSYKLLRVHDYFSPVRLDIAVSRTYSEHVVLSRVNVRCPNLKYLRSVFKLRREKDGRYAYVTQLKEIPKKIIDENIRYQVFTLSRGKHDGFYTECDTKYFGSLKFKPTGAKAIMCVSNADSVTYCTKPEAVEPFKYQSECGVQCLKRIKATGDVKAYLKAMLKYLTDALRPIGSDELGWSITPRERIKIAAMMIGLPLLDHDNTSLAVAILTMMVYSKGGCATMKPPLNIQNEAALLQDADDILALVKMEVLSLLIITDIAKTFLAQRIDRHEKVVNGDGFETNLYIARAGRLAWQNFAEILSQSFDRIRTKDFKLGEVLFWIEENTMAVELLTNYCISSIAYFTPPFNGIRVIGYGSDRIYSTRTTYKEILHYLNVKTRAEHSRNETFHHYAEFIPGPAVGDPEEDEDVYPRWLQMCEIQFPEQTLVPELASGLLTIVVLFAAAGTQGLSLTPRFLIDLRLKATERLTSFPRSVSYNVTLPILQGREPVLLDKSEFSLYKDLWHIPDSEVPSSFFSVFKVTLPVATLEHTLVLLFSESLPVRAAATVGRIPQHKDVSELPDLPMVKINESGRAKVVVRPSMSELRFLSFYLALLIPHKASPKKGNSKNGSLSIKFDSTFVTCHLLDTFEDRSSSCAFKVANDTCHERDADCYSRITCNCHEFGVVHGQIKRIESTRLLTGDILITASTTPIPGIIICCALVAMVAVLWLWGIFLDFLRNRETALNNVYDADRPRHQDHLVIGVYTGINPLSGTYSTVAIQIMGEESSSRVYVLNLFSRKILSWNRDDWFCASIDRPVGLITHVHLWLDFRLHSYWYCSQIVIFDVSSTRWYLAKVDRWFILNPTGESSLAATIPVEEIYPTSSNKSQSFSSYFFRELSVSHLPLSILFFHHRCLSTEEQKCLTYTLKILSTFVLVWCISQIWSEAFFRTVVDGRNVIGALYVAILSHIVTFPLKVLHKSKISHGIFQHRVTNPMTYSTGQAEQVQQRFARTRECLIRILLLTMGPEQFRCVNIPPKSFNKLLAWGTKSVRFATISMLPVTLGILITIEIFTNYWEHYESTLLAVSLALITDGLIIEPWVIFIRSLITYFILKLRNNDVRLWYSGEKLVEENRLSLSLTDYLELALSKEYKPLTAVDLQRKRRIAKIRAFSWWCLFYALLGMFTFSFLSTTTFRDVTMRYLVNNAVTEFQRSTRLNPRFGPEAKYVVDAEGVVAYVARNQGYLAQRWYNRKDIKSRGKTWLWAVGRTYISSDVALLIVLYQKEDAGMGSIVLLEFEEYFQVTRARFSSEYQFKGPKQLRQSSGVNNVFVYQEMSSAFVKGKTGELYPLKGHTNWIKKYPIWSNYYKDLKAFLVLMFQKRKRTPDAVILLTEVFCASFPSVARIDVIVENHFTGPYTAKTEVHLIPYSRLRQSTSIFLHNACVAFALIVLLLFNIFIICQQGILEYLTKFEWIVKLAILLVGGWGVVLEHHLRQEMVRNYDTYQDHNQVSRSSDYYGIYDVVENKVSLLLGLLYLLICVEATLCLRRLRERDILKGDTLWCSRLVGAVFLMAIILLTAVETVEELGQSTLSVLLLLTRQLVPYTEDYKKYMYVELISFLVGVVMLKTCVGVVIYQCSYDRFLSGLDVMSGDIFHPSARRDLAKMQNEALNEQIILDRKIQRLTVVDRPTSRLSLEVTPSDSHNKIFFWK